MTLYALTHAGKTFRAGVAISSVTDWKYYDSIYTERYMKLPKENEEGYKAASVLESAKDLDARLLLLHGTSDDNVHLQNSIAFADAAMRAKRTFEFLPFARQKHGFRDPALRLYSLQVMVEFFQKNL
jgi:dipeptidyl-peptidase-4